MRMGAERRFQLLGQILSVIVDEEDFELDYVVTIVKELD